KAKAAELKTAAGSKPFLISGVSGEGVRELLRAAWAKVRQQRGEAVEEETEASAGDWTP
ncbi:MAG TPA: GTPase ObgE, partial [Caulobacteraceae bacterium]